MKTDPLSVVISRLINLIVVMTANCLPKNSATMNFGRLLFRGPTINCVHATKLDIICLEEAVT